MLDTDYVKHALSQIGSLVGVEGNDPGDSQRNHTQQYCYYIYMTVHQNNIQCRDSRWFSPFLNVPVLLRFAFCVASSNNTRIQSQVQPLLVWRMMQTPTLLG